MEDILGKIKSIFVVTDPNAPKGTQIPQEQTSNPINPAESKISNPLSVNESQNLLENPTNEMTEILFKAIEANNLNGFDYLEYKNSLKSLDNVIPDEGTRFKSAFEMGKTMGLSKDLLVKGATHYLSILNSEYEKFNNSVERQKAIKIQERSQQMTSFQKDIEQKKATILSLQEEIKKEEAQLQAIKTEIDESAQKIDKRSNEFKASFSLLYNQIETDVKKINQYIS